MILHQLETLHAQRRRWGEPIVSRRPALCPHLRIWLCRACVADITDLGTTGASRVSMTVAPAKMIQYASHCTSDGWQSEDQIRRARVAT